MRHLDAALEMLNSGQNTTRYRFSIELQYFEQIPKIPAYNLLVFTGHAQRSEGCFGA
jgi:hypothetical protein